MRVQGKARTSGENMIDFGDGVVIPQEVEVTADALEGLDGHRVSVRADYNPDTGRYECRSITVTGADAPAVEVTGESMRAVPVQTVLNVGVADALSAFTLLNLGQMPDDITEGGPTTRALRWVAYLYRVALIFGRAPVAAVAETMNLPKSTANRWVTRARDRGMLTAQDKRGQHRDALTRPPDSAIPAHEEGAD